MTNVEASGAEIYRSVQRIAYIALNCRAVEEQVEFYTQMAGLGETDRDDSGRVYLRCDDHHHGVVLVPAETGGGLHHFGLDVGSESSLEAAAKALDAAGIDYESSPPPLLGQGPCLEFRDSVGMVVRLVASFESVSPNIGVRAVKPRKLGHLTFVTTNLKACEEMYTQVLGLRVSDWFLDNMVWLRCNPDHHGIAFMQAPRAGIQHFAFEVQDFSELGRQADHLARHGYRLAWGPGRHGPGNNLFLYFLDLERNVVEFTCDVQQIWDEETYVPKNWTPQEAPANVWGIEPSPEFLASIG